MVQPIVRFLEPVFESTTQIALQRSSAPVGQQAFVSKSISGRSFPVCDGNGNSPAASISLAPIELAFDSNVLSFGSGAFFDSSVSIKAEFFGTSDAGDRSINVSSAGFSSNGTVGEKTPPKAASKNATAR